MKIKFFKILIMTIVLICSCTMAQCESTTGVEIIPDEEWSWSRGAYNTFTGRIDLSGCDANEMIVSITADLPYNPDTEKQSMPVFTSVNGKRIVMTKQSDKISLIPDTGSHEAEFAVSFRLPEKKRVESVEFVFRITDPEGNELKTVSGRIDNGRNTDSRAGDPFFINADIRMIALILAVSSVLVWAFVLIREIKYKKKHDTGER